MQRRRFLLSASALALALAVPLPRALAQGCSGDDGFAAVPCCTPASPTIPVFPAFTLTGDYACIKDCALEAQFGVTVAIGHVPVLCDYRVIPLTVTPVSAGAPGWTAVLLAKYSRTWLEMDASGTINRQVWRFLVNADLTPTAGAQPCPIPADPIGLRVQFHGHLDYACDNTPPMPTFSAALSLHHLPGCIEHNTFSCVGLPPPFDHPERSFHLVAPGGFSFTPVAEPQGVTPADAVRSSLFPSPIACLGEAPVAQGSVLTTTKGCLCVPTGTGPFQWCHQTIVGTAQCTGMLSPYSGLPVAAPLPPLPTGFATLPLGRWTGAPGTFPGARELAVHWGILSYADGCNPSDFPVQIVQGVSTSRAPGRVFSSTSTAVFNTFMDFQDMLRTASSTGLMTPSWGCTFFSKRLWNLNL